MINDEWKDFHFIEKSLSGKFTDTQLEIVNKIEATYFAIKLVLYRREKDYELENARENVSMNELMMNQTQFVHELSLLNKKDSEVRLPRVDIPTFSGNYAEFPSFRDLFEASIDKREGMSNAHKLQYLKSLLKGEAYTLIKHLNVTEVNYSQAWEKIKARYNKPKHVIYNLLKQFMDQPVLHQGSAKGLRHLTDISDEVIHGLHVLGENAEKRDLWLIYILTHKLDADSREAWAHASANQDFPSFNNFIEFLNKRSDALECISSTQKQKSSPPKKIGAMTSQVTDIVACPMCSGTHYLGKCEAYLKLTSAERKTFTVNKKLCFNCLSSTHQSIVCRSKYVCHICKRRHHVTLHLDIAIDPSRDQSKEAVKSEPVRVESSVNIAIKSSHESINSHQAILPTAIVLIEDKYGQMQRCRALLDSGSQSSFMSENCAQRLQLARQRANVHIKGLTAGNLISRGKSTITLRSMYDHDSKMKLEVLIISHLPTQIPKIKISLGNKDFARELELADPHFDIPTPIDLLLGADKFFEILQNNQRRYDSLILSKTIFGWVVSGQPQSTDVEDIQAFTTFTRDNTELEETLRKFWEIEDTALDINKFTPEESECERIFVNTHERTSDGRYIVKLPFKENSGMLGNSLQAATIRFRSLERKLAKNQKLRETYIDQIREYINLGHMIEVSANYKHNEGYYLPHHFVTKESSKTTKVRIVFDGSSKTSSGLSLNDKLMIGPTIQPTLWDTILRFRINKIALVADIEKMYRQVMIAEEHRKYQMILWRERPDEILKSYQLTRVTFGLACSAFLAIRAMQQLAVDVQDEEVKRCIINDFYVDDILTGSNDETQAAVLKEKLICVLAKGGFCLTQWKSNIKYLCDTTDEVPVSDLGCEETSTVKTLGLQWHPTSDKFTFKIQAEREGAITKRKIISESSRLFDPLGFISPSIILIKILFQKLWLLKVDWDDKLPGEVEAEYVRIRNQFVYFEDINILRFTDQQGEVQIHGFADASELAYCAVIYSRTIKEDGSIITHLLTSKTKVAPIKKISLPRLELCAAHLLTKLMFKVKGALKADAEYFAWTDSAIVLAWLSAYPSRWKTFIANRTSKILEILPRCHWAHVKSKDNPADHGSRGVSPEKIVNLTQWWMGPEWLVLPQASWPSNENYKFQEADHEMEYSKIASSSMALNVECEKHENYWLEVLFERKSKLQKIFRIVAYVMRYINALRNAQSRGDTQLTATEITAAKLKCIMWVQRTEFLEDMNDIRRHKQVANKSRLVTLAPFIDEHGILRVGGRLQNSSCEYGNKHPIILPHKHILTTRLIWDVHLSNLHAGPTLTTNYIRQNY